MDVQASKELINGPRPPEPYDDLLQESIRRFLSDYRNGITDFSRFTSIFSRLIQKMTDPPLEIVWFYALVSFRTNCHLVRDPLSRVLVVKDLFQVLVSCSSSSSCNGLKRYAILAPVLFELYELMTNLKYSCFAKDIDCLVEGIVSYVSMCCCSDDDIQENSGPIQLGGSFEGVVRLWTVDKVEINCEFGDNLRVFFPIVIDAVRSKVNEGSGLGSLAGVVMFEAFWLRLYSKFSLDGLREELEKDMLNQAVNVITGFRNCYFIDILLKMLLEPSFPVTTLLSSKDDDLFRKVLYDAVILVDFSSFNPKKWAEFPGFQLRDLAVTWLFVADKAIRSARESGDETRAISYINAFSESHLPSQIIEWVTSQAGQEKIISRPNISSPLSLIKWLLFVEHEGILPVYKPDDKDQDDKLLCYSNNELGAEERVDDDQEMADSLNVVLNKGACTISSIDTSETRKRKEGRKDDGKARVKFFKVCLHENTLKERFLPMITDGDLGGGRELENPVFNDDTENMEM